MDNRTAQEILADAFYNRGVEPEETDRVVASVLDELSRAGYALVYSPRKNQLKEVTRQKFHNGIPVPAQFLQTEWL